MPSALPHRRSIRLREFDYSSEGLYFVTICAEDRVSRFGYVVDGRMSLNDDGRIIDEIWRSMFDFCEDSDTWIVTPNHLHGIVAITDIAAGASRSAPTRKSLGRLVGAFKTVSTNRINHLHGKSGDVIWQRNFYEHVIRNDRSLGNILAYIRDNPARWATDPENPTRQV